MIQVKVQKTITLAAAIRTGAKVQAGHGWPASAASVADDWIRW